MPCRDEYGGPCVWVDVDHTLCDNIECLASVPLAVLQSIEYEGKHSVSLILSMLLRERKRN